MIAINVLSESTDIDHVRDLQSSNTPQYELEFTQEMLQILFDDDQTTEERTEALETHLEEVDDPQDLLDGSTPREAVEGFEQFQQLPQEAFNRLRDIFLYIMGSEDISLPEVEDTISQLRDIGLGELEIMIPREDEEMAGLM
jgi:hypothetical protein